MPKYKKSTKETKPEIDVIGGDITFKNIELPVIPLSFEIGSIDFEKYCFDNYEYIISPFAGKVQLLSRDFTDLDRIVLFETERKTAEQGFSLESDFYKELKQTSEKMFYGSIALEVESCCLQMVEMLLRLILSLELNKDTELFWAPFMFCNNKDSTEYKPNSIDGFLKTVYESKDINKAISNNFDLKYIFFGNYDFKFIRNKVEYKPIKKAITKILIEVLTRFKQDHPYNQYKHGSRTYAKKFTCNLKFNHGLDSENPIYSYLPMKTFTLFSTWNIDNKTKKITENITNRDTAKDLLFCDKIMEILLHLIRIHNQKLYFTKPLDESQIYPWW